MTRMIILIRMITIVMRIRTYILVLRRRTRGIPATIVGRSLMFNWSVGPVFLLGQRPSFLGDAMGILFCRR